MAELNPAYFVILDRMNDKWCRVVAQTCDETYGPMTVLHGINVPEGEPVYSSDTDNEGRLVVSFHRGEFASRPKLWFVMSERENGSPPNIALQAFASDHFPEGTVVFPDEAIRAGVASSEQVAAVQWGMGDPKLHQIFVHPSWRRKRISLLMIGAADVVNMSGSYSGDRVIYGGDVTTDGGENLRQAWSRSPRVMPRSGTVSYSQE